MEIRLEQTRQNHNKLLDEIKTQKEEINLLRRDRVIFDMVFKDLEKDLNQKEQNFKKVLYEFVQVLNEKMGAEEELAKIKSESEREVENFTNQYDKAFKEADGNQRKEERKETLKIVSFLMFWIILKRNCNLKETGFSNKKKSIYSPKMKKQESNSAGLKKKERSATLIEDNSKKQEVFNFYRSTNNCIHF